MIAICPSCHDEIHHGAPKISDDTIYAWKAIKRDSKPADAQLFVEAAPSLKLLTGSIALTSVNDDFIAFELSNNNKLSMRALDGDLLQLSVTIKDLGGREALRVVDNVVRIQRDDRVEFAFRAGRARITAPAGRDYIEPWVIEQMKHVEPDFASGERVTLLDLEVLRPGVVRVQGYWPAHDGGVVITATSLSFMLPNSPKPLTMMGGGEDSVLQFAGPVTSALFRR